MLAQNPQHNNKIFKNQPIGRLIQIGVSALSLVGLLAYTFVHTGATLAQYINPAWVGYMAAFGIELSIVSLSLRIGDLHKQGQKAGFFYSVLVTTLLVSAIANISEGFNVNQGVSLSLDTVSRVDIIQAIVGLVSTGLIPLIVFALSEIVGSDVNQAAMIVNRNRKAEQRKVSSTVESDSLEQARIVKAEQDTLTKEDRLNTLVDTLADNPNPNKTQLANNLNISRTILYEDINTLVDTGRIETNGKGYKVVDNG